MARFGVTHDDEQSFEIEVREDGTEHGFLRPPGAELVSLNARHDLLISYPINTLAGHIRYGEAKYHRVQTIEVEFESNPDGLEEALAGLPAGFVKDPIYGLGLRKNAKSLIRLVENNSECRVIRFCLCGDSTVDGETFRIPLSEFESLWLELGRVTRRGQDATHRIRRAVTQDALKDALGLTPGRYTGGRHQHAKTVEQAAAGATHISPADGESLVDSLTSSDVLGSISAVKLKELKRDVELVNLNHLILSFTTMLDRRQSEEQWQQFFDLNAFALQQVFGAPLVRIHSKSRVGGTGLDGSSGKIADYLVRHSLTNNIALVEIKKPDTPLLARKPYRAGVYPASSDLSGALTQVLDQRYHLTQEFLALKGNTRQWDLESYSVACFVVAGRLPPADEHDQQKSLSLIRENSKVVTIITYDEVLERMRQLREFLSGADSDEEQEGNV